MLTVHQLMSLASPRWQIELRNPFCARLLRLPQSHNCSRRCTGAACGVCCGAHSRDEHFVFCQSGIQEIHMKEQEVRDRAFAMPLTQPAYPRGPYRFVDREYFIITYRTDPEKLRALVPEPLEIEAPLVKYEFIRMPDSTGFGDYTESGQIVPVSFRGRRGNYTHCMFLNDHPPIAGGRELWGFPKKLGSPTLRPETDTLIGTLDYGPVRVATGTMGYKHHAMDIATIKAGLSAPNYLLKLIPHVDGSPRICELVEYYLEDIDVKGAWTGPAALSLIPHALAPVAELPVLEVVAATHCVADLTLGLGKVVHDYLR